MLRNCECCNNQPDTEVSGDGVKIYCSECGVAVTDSRLVNHAVEMWNRVNMSADHLVIRGVDILVEENNTLRDLCKRLRAEIAANNNSPEE